jgi:hypothetical protein
MEITEGTLCIAKSIGTCVIITRKIQKNEPTFGAKIEDGSPEFVLKKDELIPLIENCHPSYKSARNAMENNIPRILAAICAHFDKRMDVLQKKVDELESNLSSVNMGLMRTQENLREHILGPY